jgi:ubiquitin-like 1-activating enzyme E1 B
MILPSPLPEPSKKAKPVVPQNSSPPSTPLRVQKRPAPDGVDGAQPTKRARLVTSVATHSPSAARRLEEDGLVLLDRNGPTDEDLDIVVID